MPCGISEIYISYKNLDRSTLGSIQFLDSFNCRKHLNNYFYMVMIEHFKNEPKLNSKEIRGSIRINLDTIPFTFEEKFSNYDSVFIKKSSNFLLSEISEKKGFLEL